MIRNCKECNKEFLVNKSHDYSKITRNSPHSYCSKKCKDKAFHKIYDNLPEIRKKTNIRTKDRYKNKDIIKICEKCGSQKNIQIHHITYDLENNYIKFLCFDCHKNLHRSLI